MRQMLALCIKGNILIPRNSTLRIARPTDQLEMVGEQYIQGLGFKVLGEFKNHNGFNGIIIGHDVHPYHLEFTHHIGSKVGVAPTQDNLLVFYIPDKGEWLRACKSMLVAEFELVESYNPYWSELGNTYQDVDGYRVVLQNA